MGGSASGEDLENLWDGKVRGQFTVQGVTQNGNAEPSGDWNLESSACLAIATVGWGGIFHHQQLEN